MEFRQPNSEIETKKTIAENEKVTQLRNHATMLEADIKRLKELVISENYEIGQLVKRRQELEENLPKLQELEIELLESNNSLKLEVNTLTEEKII